MAKKKEKEKKELPVLELPVSKDKETMQKMLKAGLHFGHRSSSWHPKMKRYIFKERNKMHIVDLVKTIDCLNEACEFLKKAAGQGNIIFVGTKKQSQDIVEQAAKRCGAFYVTRRWPGGLMTNFKVLSKRIDKLNEMLDKFEKGIEYRTKKELLDMKKDLRRLVGLYGGLRGIKRLPKAVVIVDAKYERIPIEEAQLVDVPSVALLDTNTDPRPVDYPIPGNDDASKSVALVVNTLAQAVLEGNKGRGVRHKEIDWGKIDEQIEEILEDMRKKHELPKEEKKPKRAKKKIIKKK